MGWERFGVIEALTPDLPWTKCPTRSYAKARGNTESLTTSAHP